MIFDKKVVGVIVCRKGSKRITNKTWSEINGKSLLEIKINQLKKVKILDEIIVGSNDENVEDFCKSKNITFIKRDDYYCDESKCTANEMIKNILSFIDSDIVLWAHLTNPFIDETHYENALITYEKNIENFDSVFSVSELKEHFWNTNKEPINHNPWSEKHIVAKNLSPLYKQNGGIFIRSKKDMENDGRFIGNKPYMFVMNEKDGWDLDYSWQLDFAKGVVNE